ncbi:class I SAM-dependent methyltransferase [Flavobacteriaceae bacterium]|jgi:predicted O-methyltransferase YrrM|nr:class I SAM-dependent methyltransferase [Flavobacteriaceae bacterium]
MIKYSLLAYIKFLKSSTNQHGIHSPFVYELITDCFYDKKKHHEYEVLKNYRHDLLNNSTCIQITDLGTGSRVFKSSHRKVSQIIKISGSTLKRSKLLLRLVKYFDSTNILELGTSLGIGTSALSLGNKQANITTIEGCPQTGNISQQQFDKYHFNNTNLHIGQFKSVLKKLTPITYDLVFFDGNHDKSATLDYFNLLIGSVNNESVFIFDDIHWSRSMSEAWTTIINHPKVTVSIDTFYWGIIFFRKEQVKEHFTVRV